MIFSFDKKSKVLTENSNVKMVFDKSSNYATYSPFQLTLLIYAEKFRIQKSRHYGGQAMQKTERYSY